ncbi:MAG: MBOAT family protein [Phycisphaerales bacterium]|jgi:alginate O-acetyltransferase complex protein AlgI|nr:MBOAT family protein [Phycisphaerales bacterium]MBT7171937.1 MBOAT family protein [Phycisphaerales bacterium]
MLFNSLEFVLFFAAVYSAYWALRRVLRAQNAMLLVASYFFYGWWDYRFLSLLLISTLVDFYAGAAMHRSNSPGRRKGLLLLSLSCNLGMLGFFKYFNFFSESAVDLCRMIGFTPDAVTLNIILPVGISFYTFQTLSYTIDIYRRRLKPVDDMLDFALFVSFFPQLVAGPIERASHLLPQISKPRTIDLDQVNAGIFLLLWGFFKKMVIADTAAVIANDIFNHYTGYVGADLLVGALAFTVQIYCDFSAYSDIARGLGKLMGFDLMVNFRLPYFALNPSDFWNRWHISLSSWLRDYLYIPLGGSRKGPRRTYINLSLTMLLGGLWHGASWNFILWGAFHGAILILYRFFDRSEDWKAPWSGQYNPIRILSKMALMFSLTVAGWILFRCSGVLEDGVRTATGMQQISWFARHLFSAGLSDAAAPMAAKLAWISLPLVVMQLAQYTRRDLLVVLCARPWVQVVVYALLMLGLSLFAVTDKTEFIYFAF